MSSLHLSPQRRLERGFSLVLVAILVVVLLGFVGMAIDAGHMNTTAQQLQTAADAAALAAAAKLHSEVLNGDSGGTFPITRQAAVDVAVLNEAAGEGVQLDSNSGNNVTGDIVLGTWDSDTGTFSPTTSGPRAVKVVARRTDDSQNGALALVFGSLFGIDEGQVARSAIASYAVTPNPFIIVLDPSATKAMEMTGDASLNVGDGTIQVNSGASCALDVGGSASLTSIEIEVHGSACAGSSSITGGLEEYGDVIADPLAGVLPTTSDWNTLRSSMSKPLGGNGKIANPGTFTPGYYPKGLNLNNMQVAVLLPGTYMFGASWKQVGQCKVVGAGVTILMDEGATMDVGGGSSLLLTPPLAGVFQGLSIMFHRLTTSSSACSLGGNGDISVDGTLYCPGGKVDIGGTGDGQVFGQIICNLLQVNGNGEVTGENVVPPNSAGTVMLVH